MPDEIIGQPREKESSQMKATTTQRFEEFMAESKDLGLKLKDSPEPLNFMVDERALGGKPSDPGFCDFARALKLVGATHVLFLAKNAFLILHDKRTKKLLALRFVLSREIQVMILVKDTGGNVKPGIYTLQAPHGSSTMAAIKKRADAGRAKWNEKTEQEKQAHKTKAGKKGAKAKADQEARDKILVESHFRSRKMTPPETVTRQRGEMTRVRLQFRRFNKKIESYIEA
jgi:hypothetical protein